MATIRLQEKKRQARVYKQGFKTEIRSFINKKDAERWTRQIESKMDQGSFTSQSLDERMTFSEIIERYIAEV